MSEAPRPTFPAALVALDGSERAEAVLGPAADVLAALTAPEEGILSLVRVVAPPVKIRASTGQPASQLERGDRIVREAEDYVLRLAERLRTEGIAGHHPVVTWSLWVSEEIGSTLIHAGKRAGAAEQEALFLALASHGRGRWKAGSIAMSILEHSTLPLLIVRVPSEPGGASPGAFLDRGAP